MSALIIDGKAEAERLRGEIAAANGELKRRHGLIPGLAVVLVGDDPSSALYVRSKGEQAEAVGLHHVSYHLPESSGREEVLDLVRTLNQDPTIHGILVQFPVPPQVGQGPVLDTISPDKDVDGLTSVSAGRLMAGLPGIVACTPYGCLILLQRSIGRLAGKRAVVVGRSNLMGKPMAQLLLQQDCTVTMAHSRTVDLPAVCREAEVLVVGVGRAELVRGDWIRPGAAVIDVGISRVPARDPAAAAAGKMRVVGDVAFDEAREVAGWITPVPGGVGPMTIASLLRNTVVAACRLAGVDNPLDVA